MPSLPLQQTDDHDVSLMQTKWKSIIDPLLANPISSSFVLPRLTLASGDNVINHFLGRKILGWIVVGNNAATTFYDKQASNQQPQLTLILNASGACTISLLVF